MELANECSTTPHYNSIYNACLTSAICYQCHTCCGLLNFISETGFRRGPGQSISGRASEASGAVFQALLEAALRDAAAGAFEDEEEDEGTGMNSSPHAVAESCASSEAQYLNACQAKIGGQLSA